MNAISSLIAGQWADLANAAQTAGPALLLIKLTTLLIACWALHAILLRRNARWRVMLWRATMIAAAAVVVLGATGGTLAWRLQIATRSPIKPIALAPAISHAGQLASIDPQSPSTVGDRRPLNENEAPQDDNAMLSIAQAPPPSAANHAAASISIIPWPHSPVPWIPCVWFAGIVALLIRRRIGRRLLERVVANAAKADDSIQAIIRQTAEDLGTAIPATLVAEAIGSPFIVGSASPTLVLPRRMAEPEYAQALPAIIAHELAHLRGQDLAWGRVFGAIRMLLWFHPLAWRIPRAHAEACDEVCDAISAQYIGDPKRYEQTLARAALELQGLATPAGGLAIVRRPHVLQRLTRLRRGMSAQSLAPATRNLVLAAAALGALALGTVRLAFAQPGASSPPSIIAEGPSPDAIAPPSIAPTLPYGAIIKLGGKPFQQAGSTGAMAISTDGKTIVTGVLDEKTIYIWDADSGSLLRKFDLDTMGTDSLAFSPDGRTLAIGTDERLRASGSDTSLEEFNVALWDAKTWTKIDLQTPPSGSRDDQPHGRVYGLAFSPDGALLASQDERSIRIWDTAAHKQLRELKWSDRMIESALALSPDGKRIAASDDRGNLFIGPIDGSSEPLKINAAVRELTAIAWTPDGSTIVTGGATRNERISNDPPTTQQYGAVRLWNAKTGEKLAEFGEAKWAITSFAWSPDRKTLAVGRMNKQIELWRLAEGNRLSPFEPEYSRSGGIYQMAFTPDGSRLVQAGRGNVLAVFDAKTGAPLLEGGEGHTDRVRTLAYSRDGKFLATAGWDQTVRIWDAATGRQIKKFNGDADFDDVAWSDDGHLLAGTSALGSAAVWDASDDSVVLKIPVKRGAERLVLARFSHDGKSLAVGYGLDMPGIRPKASAGEAAPSQVRLWNLETKQPLGDVAGADGTITDLAFSSDDAVLAIFDQGGKVIFRDLKADKELQSISIGNLQPAPLQGVAAISPDLRRAAWTPNPISISGRMNKTFGVTAVPEPLSYMLSVPVGFSFESFAQFEPARLPWPAESKHAPNRFNFSPDSRFLAGQFYDSSLIRIWNAADASVYATLNLGQDAPRIESAAISPDDKRLAAGFDNGEVLIWDMASLAGK